jgi:hypothetical protein
MAEPDSTSAFVNMSPEEFPFTVQLHDEGSGELVYEEVIWGAGALKVPGFHPRKIATTIISRDGYRTTLNSAGEDVTPWGQESSDTICDGPGADAEMMFSCIPYNVNDYSPIRLQVWLRALEAAGQPGKAFIPYPGSTPAVCAQCAIAVALGPRQKHQMDHCVQNGMPTMITCMLCSVMLRKEQTQKGGPVINLGNPDDPNG